MRTKQKQGEGRSGDIMRKSTRLFLQLHSIRHEYSTTWEQRWPWNARLGPSRNASLNWTGRVFSLQTIVCNFAFTLLHTGKRTGSYAALPVVLRVENGRDSLKCTENSTRKAISLHSPALLTAVSVLIPQAAEILCSWARHGKSCSEHKSSYIANILKAELVLHIAKMQCYGYSSSSIHSKLTTRSCIHKKVPSYIKTVPSILTSCYRKKITKFQNVWRWPFIMESCLCFCDAFR